jgi:hypothetical protein
MRAAPAHRRIPLDSGTRPAVSSALEYCPRGAMMRSYNIVSADSHINEPPDVFKSVPARLYGFAH